MTDVPLLEARDLTVGYGALPVLQALGLSIPQGQVTTIIGPNACGKSTLLRVLGRLLKPSGGQVLLDGKAIHRQPTRQVARKLGLLPQTPIAPEGMSVEELIGRGRTPYQTALRQWSQEDAEAVAAALDQTDLTKDRHRAVDDLSGGQRQRAWIAMVLAQKTPLLLLDEPTTYLDLRHQIEVLSLIRKLNREVGKTVVMVLHDINLAARFSDHLAAIKDGQIMRQGAPEDVVDTALIDTVFGLQSTIIRNPIHNMPHVIPS